jgi:addiction module RelE/StbE family toxin
MSVRRYRVILTRQARQDYQKICNRKLLDRINELLVSLETDPHQGKPLHGYFRGLRAFKTFSYRIFYRIEKGVLIVTVIKIEHRKDVYR